MPISLDIPALCCFDTHRCATRERIYRVWRSNADPGDALHRRGIVHERRMGVPGRVYFRLDLEQLIGRLSGRVDFDPCSVTWHDRVVVAELLGPTVAYHRALAGIGGGVHAGLMLSRALYLTRIQATRQLDV